MEIKWIAIMSMVMFLGMFVGIGYSEYAKKECRIEAIKAGVDAEQIKNICGK